MKRIYGISSGSYSDYGVLAVAEDKPTAEAWAAALRDDPGSYHGDAFVEEFELLEKGTAPFRATVFRLSVTLWDDGTEETARVTSETALSIALFDGPPPRRPRVRKVRAPIHNGKGGRIDIVGASDKAVRKVAHDQVLMWRAATDKRAFWGRTA